MIHFKKRRHGATVIEMAIVVPVVLVAVCATIDYTRIFQVEAAISHAAYDAAVFGAANNFHESFKDEWIAEVRERASEGLQTAGCIELSKVSIDVATEAVDSGVYLVTVTITSSFDSSVLSHFYPHSTIISRSRAMKRFR